MKETRVTSTFCRLLYPDRLRVVASLDELKRLAESAEDLGHGVFVRAELEVCSEKIDEYLVHKLGFLTKTITEQGCGVEVKFRRPLKPMTEEEKGLMTIPARCLSIRIVGDQVKALRALVSIVENIEKYTGEAKV